MFHRYGFTFDRSSITNVYCVTYHLTMQNLALDFFFNLKKNIMCIRAHLRTVPRADLDRLWGKMCKWNLVKSYICVSLLLTYDYFFINRRPHIHVHAPYEPTRQNVKYWHKNNVSTFCPVKSLYNQMFFVFFRCFLGRFLQNTDHKLY